MEEQPLLQGCEQIEILYLIGACPTIEAVGTRRDSGLSLSACPCPMPTVCQQPIKARLIEDDQWEVRGGPASYSRLEAVSQQLSQSLQELLCQCLDRCPLMQLLTIGPLQMQLAPTY